MVRLCDMAVTACPIAVIKAPTSTIWRLLTTREGYDEWADARVVAIQPPGSAAEGQLVEFQARALGIGWRVEFRIAEVVPSRSLGIDVRLPLGIVNHEHITLLPLSERETRVTFN